MKQQNGSSLIVAIILLGIITVVAVYSLEGSNLQSKMVANSLFSSLTYQECRNEQEAQILFYNINGGSNRNALLDLTKSTEDADGNLVSTELKQVNTLTEVNTLHPPKSDINITWRYIDKAPAARGGYDLGSGSSTVNYLLENDCISNFRFSTNNQTQGAIVEGLKQAGNIN